MIFQQGYYTLSLWGSTNFYEQLNVSLKLLEIKEIIEEVY